MKSTRKWFYMGGPLTVLVLALMGMLWAMSASAAPPAATALTAGDVSTDVPVVSSDSANIVLKSGATPPGPDRTVTATLTNAALNKVIRVGNVSASQLSDLDLNNDNKKDANDFVTIHLALDVLDGDSFRVELGADDGAVGSDPGGKRTYGPQNSSEVRIQSADNILPIGDRNGDGNVTVADIEVVAKGAGVEVNHQDGVVNEVTTVGPKDVRVVEILDAAAGRLRFEATEPLAAASVIGLRFVTSPQETALVNLEGDIGGGGMDLLTVESVAGPSGEYNATFQVVDRMLMQMGADSLTWDHDGDDIDNDTRKDVSGMTSDTATHNLDNNAGVALATATARIAVPGITHEQHNIPAGLLGNIQLSRQTVGVKKDDNNSPDNADDDFFYVELPNVPLRDTANGLAAGVAGAVITADDVDVNTSGVSAVAFDDSDNTPTTGKLRVSGASLAAGQQIQVTYRGSSNFEISMGSLKYAPVTSISTENADALNGTFVVPTASYTDAAGTGAGDTFTKYFSLLSSDNDKGTYKIGVIHGSGGDDKDLSAALPGHLTVMGVTYQGSENVSPGRALLTGDWHAVTLDNTAMDANSTVGLDAGDFAVKVTTTFDIVDYDHDRDDKDNDTRKDVTGMTYDTDTHNMDDSVALNTATARRSPFCSPTVATCPATPTGNTLVLTPTGAVPATAVVGVNYAFQTGYNAQNALLPRVTTARPTVLVSSGSRVTVRSANASATMDAESDPPTYSNPTPASGGASGDLAQTVSIDITDAVAGVDTKSIVFLVRETRNSTAVDLAAETVGWKYGDVKEEPVTIVTDGDRVTASVALDKVAAALTGVSISSTDVTHLHWGVTATDKAGNKSLSDANTASTATGNQGYYLRIDKKAPRMTGAHTGDHWNADATDPDDDATDKKKGVVQGDRRLGPGDYLPGSSDANMIRVQFDEDLDGSSVAADDFTVTGSDGAALTVSSASWYNATNNDKSTGAPAVKNSVFLRLSEALGAGDTPSVQLSGTVSDAAGNTVSGTTVTAADGIAPTATIAVDPAVSTKAVAITVTTDEGIRTQSPTLRLYTTDNADADTAVATMENITIPAGARTAGENEWTFNLSISGKGRYSITAMVDDAARNQSMAGQKRWMDGGAVSFEIDNSLTANSLNTRPKDKDTKATLSDPFFIEIDWLEEGKEYVGDTQKSVTLTKAVLNAGKTDERDVMGLASSRDNQRWTIAISGMSLGDYTLTFNGQDAAGNTLESDATLTFKVVERPPFNLSLAPGLNLVSIPGDPANKDINAVFGDHDAVDLVYTRAGDIWLVAQRSATSGKFEATGGVSDLTDIEASRAYFVRSTSSVTVGIDIPARSPLAPLPAVTVTGGQYNLVPVISLLPLEKIPAGSALDADSYLGADWTRAFTYDRGRWSAVVPNADVHHQCTNPDTPTVGGAANKGNCGTQDTSNLGEYFTASVSGQSEDKVEIGRGYWVWYTKDGTITP